MHHRSMKAYSVDLREKIVSQWGQPRTLRASSSTAVTVKLFSFNEARRKLASYKASQQRWSNIRLPDTRERRGSYTPDEEKIFQILVGWHRLFLFQLGRSGGHSPYRSPLRTTAHVVRIPLDAHRQRCCPLLARWLAAHLRPRPRGSEQHLRVQWRPRSGFACPDRFSHPLLRA